MQRVHLLLSMPSLRGIIEWKATLPFNGIANGMILQFALCFRISSNYAEDPGQNAVFSTSYVANSVHRSSKPFHEMSNQLQNPIHRCLQVNGRGLIQDRGRIVGSAKLEGYQMLVHFSYQAVNEKGQTMNFQVGVDIACPRWDFLEV